MIERASKKKCDSKNKGFSFEIGEPALAPGPEVGKPRRPEGGFHLAKSKPCLPTKLVWNPFTSVGLAGPVAVEGKQMQLVMEAVAVEGKQMEAASGGDFHN